MSLLRVGRFPNGAGGGGGVKSQVYQEGERGGKTPGPMSSRGGV